MQKVSGSQIAEGVSSEMVVRLFLVAESSRWWYNKIIFIRQEIDNFLVLKEEIMDRVCVGCGKVMAKISERYELATRDGLAFVCKDCAREVGIKNMFAKRRFSKRNCRYEKKESRSESDFIQTGRM